MRRAVLLICLAACGRLSFDDARTRGDGGDRRSDGASPDVMSGCWEAWRSGSPSLSAPQPVAELNTGAAEGDPSLSADGLTLYFARENPTTNDLFAATRPDRFSAFGPATQLIDLSSSGDDTKLSLSNDRLLAIWSSNRLGSMGYDLWQSVRTTSTGTFPAADQAPFVQINNNLDQFDPHLSSDGLRLYLAPSSMTTQTVQVSTRATLADAFSAPVDVVDLATGFHADPTLSPDELVIVYSARQNSAAPLTIWYATRTTTAAPFSNGQPVPGIGVSSEYGQDPLLSSDGCELFFSNHDTPSPDLYLSVVL